MIALVAAILVVLSIFGAGVMRLSFQEAFRTETEQAAQRAAEASASIVAKLVYLQRPDDEVTESGVDEAFDVGRANVQLGELDRAEVAWAGPAQAYLAHVEVTLTTTYGGFAGPVTFTVTGVAEVPWSEPP